MLKIPQHMLFLAQALFAWSILKHKFYILLYGWRVGLPLKQLLIHDLSKFSSPEFRRYAVHFYNRTYGFDFGNRQAELDRWIEVSFKLAAEHHKTHNKHHLLYWKDRQLTMPPKYVTEMIVDWLAAGKVYGRKDLPETCEDWDWYQKVRKNVLMNPALVDVVLTQEINWVLSKVRNESV